MMLAPKQFDPVNRDLEIRDLYNMEDAFQLAEAYQGAYRARLNANLAFWDGLDGKTDWPTDGNGTHPLTELVLADFLVVDLTKPYAEQGSFFEIERPARAAHTRPAADGPQRRRDGHDVHAARQRRQRPRHPRRRRPGDEARVAHLPYLAAANPDPRASRAPLASGSDTVTAARAPASSSTTSRAERCTSDRPLRRHLPAPAHRRPHRGRRELVAAAPGRRPGRPSSDPARDAWITVAFTYHGLKALGVPQDSLDSFAPEFRQGWRRARPSSATSARAAPPTGRSRSGPPMSTSRWRRSRPMPARLAVVERARRAHQELPGVEVIWRQDCYQLRRGAPRSASRTGSASRRWRERILARTPRSGRSRPASSSSAIRTRRKSAADADARGARPHGTYIVSQAAHARRGLPALPARQGREPRGGGAARREDGRPLAERRPARALPGTRRSRARRRPHRNNDFLYADDLRGSSARPARTRDARTRGTRSTTRQRQRPPPPHDPARHELRPDVARGRARGRRRRSGIIFVFAGAHLKRQFEFVKTQWLNDGIFIGARREGPLVGPNDGSGSSPSRSGRSGAGQNLPPFVVTRGGEYRFAPGLRAALAGGAGDVKGDHEREDDVATSPTRTDRWKALDFGPPRPARPSPTTRARRASPAGAIALITLNRPHADNAITTEMGAADRDPGDDRGPSAVRVAIITGAGERAFSVGSDLRQRKDMTKEDWLRQRQDFDRTLYTLRQLRKPIFAAVNGIAYGGGSEIAQSTDFIIASDNATFGQPEAMIGLAPAAARRPCCPCAAAREGPADADDGRPDHRAGGAPAGHGQRDLPSGRADGGAAPDRRQDREQLRRRRSRRSSVPSAWARGSRSSRRSRS